MRRHKNDLTKKLRRKMSEQNNARRNYSCTKKCGTKTSATKKKNTGQPIAGRVVVSLWLSKFNFSTLSMS